jgi:hypothetical protein
VLPGSGPCIMSSCHLLCAAQVRAIAAELAAEQEAHATEVRARQEVEQERDEARRWVDPCFYCIIWLCIWQ